MDAEILGGYFRKLEHIGWHRAILQNDTWQTGYNRDRVSFRVDPHWAYAQAPLNDIACKAEPQALMLAGGRLLMAKVCEAPDGQRYVSAEWPAGELNQTSLELMLTAIIEGLRSALGHAATQDQRGVGLPSSDGLVLYIPEERIWQYLRQVDMLGWSLGGEPEKDRWRFAYRGQAVPFEVDMVFTASWTHFHAPLGVEMQRPSQSEALLRYLLRMNGCMAMTKFSWTVRGLELVVQVPTEQLSFPIFETCMQAMATYLDRCAPEAILLARSHRLRGFTETGQLPQVVGIDIVLFKDEAQPGEVGPATL